VVFFVSGDLDLGLDLGLDGEGGQSRSRSVSGTRAAEEELEPREELRWRDFDL
jgi:hypothetical protein